MLALVRPVELLGPLLSFLGGIVGVHLAAAAALARFRHERVFDQKREWYLSYLQSLHKLASSIAAVRTIKERHEIVDDDARMSRDVAEQLVAASNAFDDTCNDVYGPAALLAPVYADQFAGLALHEVNEILAEEWDPILTSPETLRKIEGRLLASHGLVAAELRAILENRAFRWYHHLVPRRWRRFASAADAWAEYERARGPIIRGQAPDPGAVDESQ